MASEDAFVQFLIWNRILPGIAVIIFVWYYKRNILGIIRDIHLRGYAWILNKFTGHSFRGMKRRKLQMFQPLHDLQKSLNRALNVLEIGAGSSANLEYYPRNTKLTSLEPNPHFKKYMEPRLKSGVHGVKSNKFVIGYAEDMPVDTNSVDAVVCSFVLCTVSDIQYCTEEVLRVLRPIWDKLVFVTSHIFHLFQHGIFIFLEHTAAEQGTLLRRIQECVNPVWRLFTDGCNVNRDTKSIIEKSGFSSVSVQSYKFKWWTFLLRPHIVGVAFK